jgi:adenylyl cyclase-associated protein
MLDAPAPIKKAAETDMSAVFAQLNQGEAITSGLRKVDKSKMTHKNPELRASGMVTSNTGRSFFICSSAFRGLSAFSIFVGH